MTEAVEVRGGKGYAVRIPGTLAGKLGLREGGGVIIMLEGDRMVIRKRSSIYEIALEIPPGRLGSAPTRSRRLA